jgi:hypothetical protein
MQNEFQSHQSPHPFQSLHLPQSHQSPQSYQSCDFQNQYHQGNQGPQIAWIPVPAESAQYWVTCAWETWNNNVAAYNSYYWENYYNKSSNNHTPNIQQPTDFMKGQPHRSQQEFEQCSQQEFGEIDETTAQTPEAQLETTEEPAETQKQEESKSDAEENTPTTPITQESTNENRGDKSNEKEEDRDVVPMDIDGGDGGEAEDECIDSSPKSQKSYLHAVSKKESHSGSEDETKKGWGEMSEDESQNESQDIPKVQKKVVQPSPATPATQSTRRNNRKNNRDIRNNRNNRTRYKKRDGDSIYDEPDVIKMVHFGNSDRIPRGAQQNFWNFIQIHLTQIAKYTVRGQLEPSSGKGFMRIQKGRSGWWAHIAFDSQKEAQRFQDNMNRKVVSYKHHANTYEITFKVKDYIDRHNR